MRGAAQGANDRRRRRGVNETIAKPGIERAFAAAMSSSRDGVVIFDLGDPLRSVIFANRAFIVLTGLAQPDVLGESAALLRKISHEPDLAQRAERALQTGEALDTEFAIARKDGGPLWCDLSIVPVGSAGQAAYAVATLSDATPRRRAEERAQASEQRLEDFIKAASDWLWETDSELRFTSFSAKFSDRAGADSALILGKTREDLVPADERGAELWRQHFADLSAHRPFRDFVYRARLPSGQTHWVRISGQPCFDTAGRFQGYRGVGSDITDRVEAEHRVQAQTAHLRATFEAMDQGIAIFDADQRLVTCNRRYKELSGFPASLLEPGTPVRDIVHHMAGLGDMGAGDQQRLVDAFLAERERTYGTRRTIKRADGRIHEVVAYRTPDGGSVSLATDVTDRIVTEQQVRTADQRLIEALSAVPAAITVWNADDRLVFRTNLPKEVRDSYGRYLRPGITFEESLRGLAAMGRYAFEGEAREAFIQARLRDHRKPHSTVEYPIAGGGWVKLVETRLSDGGSIKVATDVTEIKRREQEFARQSQTLRTTFDSMGEGIALFDAELNLVAYNELYPVLVEMPEEFFKPGTALRTIALRAAQRGDYGAGDPEALADRFIWERERSFGKRRVVHRKSGVSAEIEATRMPDGGSVSLVRDVTERVWLERLRDNSRMILERMARGDSAESVLAALSGLVEQFSSGTACTINWGPVDTPPGSEPVPGLWRNPIAAPGSGVLGSVDIRLPDGKEIELRDREVVEQATYLAGIVIEQKLAMDRQRQLEERLKRTERLRSLGMLAGGIGHEINNALLPIVALAEMALEATPPGPIDPANVRLVFDCASRIEALVKKFLAFSGSDEGGRQRLDLARVTGDMIAEHRRALPSHIALADRLSGEPIVILADPRQIRQIIGNLVSNAANAIGDHPGRIVLSVDTVEEAAGRMAHLSVADDGPGIPEAMRARLFDPFFTTSEVGGGVGLGLSIVHGIVAALGGSIEVTSAPGMGTSFSILIPLAGADAEESASPDQSSPDETP